MQRHLLPATLTAIALALPLWAQEASTADDQATQAEPSEDGGTDAAPAQEGTEATGADTDQGEADAGRQDQSGAGETDPDQAGAAQAEAPAEPAPVEVDTTQVLATVNGTDITLGHVIVARRSLPEQFQGLPDDVLLPGLVDQLVQQTLLSEALSAVPPSVEIQIENETRNLRAGAALRETLADAVTEEAVRAAYEERVAGVEPSTEYHASHILVESEEAAREAIAEIEGGADFADVARARSTGPSGPSGGDLGFFGEGMMVPPFEEAVKQLEPGEISEPVETQFGWHVIRLEETREAAAPAFETLAPEIATQLQGQAAESYLAELTEGADVTREPLEGIDPSVLSRATIE